MKAFLSRYRLSYPRTLIYMFQASEYYIRDYLEWLHRTRDFGEVARRRHLEETTKARTLLVIAWTLELIGLTAGAVLIIGGKIILGLGMIFITPWLLPYVLLIPVMIGAVTVQRWQEAKRNRQTAAKLNQVKAIKIAIAGSYGKTTMKELLATVLSRKFKVAVTPGNLNTPAGIARFASSLAGDESVLVFELGEYYPGDIRELSQLVDPDIGVITGVNEAHLRRFKTLARAQATIFELADYLADKPVYVNAESKHAASRIESSHRPYDSHGCGGWRVERSSVKVSLEGLKFTIKNGSQAIKVSSGLIGRHQIGPLTAAAAMAAELGMDPVEIEAAIAETNPFNHRLQPRKQADGVWVIDDTYNGNPDGVRAAIEFLRDLKGHRRIYVTPGLVEMGEEAIDIHREIGRQLANAVELVVLADNSVTPFIREGLEAAGFRGQVKTYPDSLAAIKAMPSLTKAGDVVIIQNDWGDNYA